MKYHQVLKILASGCLLTSLIVSCRTTTAIDKQTIDFNLIQEIAAKTAKGTYSPAEPLKNDITSSEYSQITFNQSRDLWLSDKLLYRLEFFHLGYLYDTPVSINEFKGGYTQPVRFSDELFNYGALPQKTIDKITSLEGYSGFRILYQLNQPNAYDEVISFLGNSSFRALARNNIYGAYAYPFGTMSGDKLEAAHYTQFWIGKPSAQEKTLVFYAIAECPSAAGAFEYKILPGDITQIKVRSTIFLRNNVSGIAVAPITSSFKSSQNTGRVHNDIYPEIHDADGFILKSSTETVWTPLDNVEKNINAEYFADNLKYFGLIQRERDYEKYLNPAVPLNLTPSVWIVPDGYWNKGRATLTMSPYSHDNARNIMAYWCYNGALDKNAPYHFDYTLNWSIEEPKSDLVKAVSTRLLFNKQDKTLTAAIRYAGEQIKNLPPVTAITPVVEISGNAEQAAEPTIIKDTFNGEWRVLLQLKQKNQAGNADGSSIIKCYLTLNGKAISEEWIYKWTP